MDVSKLRGAAAHSPPSSVRTEASVSPWQRELREICLWSAPLLDFIGVLLAARLASLILLGFPELATLFWNPWERWTLVPAVLAPFLLQNTRQRGGVHGAQSSVWAGIWARVARASRFAMALLPRFILLSVLALLVGFSSGSLASVPLDWLGLWLVLAFGIVLLIRLSLARLTQREVIAVVGAGVNANRLLASLRASRSVEIDLLGVFDDRSDGRGTAGFQRSGSISDLLELGRHRVVDWVLVGQPGQSDERRAEIVHRLKALDVPVGLCPQSAGDDFSLDSVGLVGKILPVTLLAQRPIRRWGVVVKALEDYLLGGLITLLLLPLLGLIALAIKCDGPGPVLFKQARHAWNNGEFKVLKFRTMRWDPKSSAAPLTQTARDDPRITRLGRFLRRTSLDELPQMFNVLRGEMSLVGPRPHALNMRTEERLGHEIIAAYAHRHRVKPGLTGWAQVNGYRGATHVVEQLRRRVELDLEYVENWSYLFDLKILFMTAKIVLRGTNAF